ncbi:hypothetical protein Tco_1068415 [Tanacetum coccineum]|uniref:Uncharacterized protein n=1 Tax=Tanacetum coccineum TaxID=301880 RepID=A0ABQ5HFN7_9ASTR
MLTVSGLPEQRDVIPCGLGDVADFGPSSDSEDSTVTYTEVSSPLEDLSDIGSPGVDRLPMMLEDPYGPEHPPSHVYVPYVPEPLYLEFMPPEDDMLLAEEQPLSAAILPTADSPGYITESDLEEDPEEDDEDPDDYPTNRDDGKEEEEEESSRDNVDDEEGEEDEDEDKDKEEEEHLAPTDSVPPPVHRVTARISIRAHTPILLPSETEVARLLDIPTTPPSPLSPWSSPLPQIPSPPLPVSPPLPISPPPLPVSPTYPLGYRAAMIWLRAESPSTSHPLPLPSPIVLPYTRASMAMMRAAAPSTYILAPRLGILPSDTPPSGTPPLLPIPLPTPSPLLLLPSTDCRVGVSEVTLPPWKSLYIALGLRFEIGASSSAPTARPTGGFRAEYEFVGTLDDKIRRDHEIEVDRILTRFIGDWDNAQDDRLLMNGQLNMLRKDRRTHARTARLMETEARLSREA